VSAAVSNEGYASEEAHAMLYELIIDAWERLTPAAEDDASSSSATTTVSTAS
jgi:hypothetical protein